MTGGEQDLVVWKPMQAPRQHSVQYMPRKALLLSAPFSTLAQISSPPFSSRAFLQSHIKDENSCIQGAYGASSRCQMSATGISFRKNELP